MSPIAESGVAIPSIELAMSCWPDSETGRTSMSSSMTRSRRLSSVRTRPKIETSTIVSGKSEKSTWKEIEAAYCGSRSRKRSSIARGRALAMPDEDVERTAQEARQPAAVSDRPGLAHGC